MRNSRLTAASCCLWLLSTLPAFAAEQLPSGAYMHDPVPVGAWTLRRITSDAAGKEVLACEATWTRESDLHVMAKLDVKQKTFALGVPTFGRPRGKPATMRAWFNSDKADAVESVATFQSFSGNADDEDGYLLLVEARDKQGLADRLAKARTVTFAYPFEGKTRIEAFPFKTAQQAMKQLAACASHR